MKAKHKISHKTKIDINAPLIDAEDFSDLEIQSKQMEPTGGYVHRLESHFSGSLPTKKMGSGMDYAESRAYQAGDDPRFINWRLTARSNETLVKNFHTESNPTLCILMDRGATMCFGTCKRLKITQAARVATLLSLSARQHRLALSGLILDESKVSDHVSNQSSNQSSNQWFPSSSNDQAFNSWIDSVKLACPPLSNFQALKSPKDWQLNLQNLADKNPAGSLIYLVSDFSGLTTEHQSTLEALQAQHHVIAIHISDPAEHHLSNNGTIRFKDARSNALYQVESSRNKQREKFQSHAQVHQDSLKKIFEDRGIPFVSILTTDDDLALIIPLPLEVM